MIYNQIVTWTAFAILAMFPLYRCQNFYLLPQKIGFLAQKRPNLAQNWHFCPLLTHLVPCWWVGWWLWRGLYLARHIFTLFTRVTTVFLKVHNSLEHSRRPKVSWLQVRVRLWNMLEQNWRRCLKVRWRNEPCLKVRWRHLKWMAHKGKSAEDRLENKSWPTETVCLILSS